eukprot:2701808-Rhodomonas_salina.2
MDSAVWRAWAGGGRSAIPLRTVCYPPTRCLLSPYALSAIPLRAIRYPPTRCPLSPYALSAIPLRAVRYSHSIWLPCPVLTQRSCLRAG